MVLPPAPTAKSLSFLTIYHCKCLIDLLAAIQFVFIITLTLEGRYLGLLLYKDIFFFILELYMLIKGRKLEEHLGLISYEFKREIALIHCPCSILSIKEEVSPHSGTIPALKMQCPLCPSPRTGGGLESTLASPLNKQNVALLRNHDFLHIFLQTEHG